MPLTGYRNQLVHFYHEVLPDELYDVCARRWAMENRCGMPTDAGSRSIRSIWTSD